MLAECVVALGTMLIPLGIVLLTAVKGFSPTLAQNLIIVGIVALVTGLVIAVRNEIRASRRDKRLDEREIRRRRIDKSVLIVLTHMAEKSGVDMEQVVGMMERKLDEKLDD